MIAQHHLRVLGEVAVHLDAGRVRVVAIVIRRRLDRGEVDPGRAGGGLAGVAALEHQQIGHHVGAGGCAHAGLGQAHRADQVGHAGDVLARRGADLVHRAGAGDEQREATGTQPLDRARDEIVMQPEPQRPRGGIGPHHAIREGRVPDRQIEAAGERAARVVLAPHPRLGMHKAGDAGGDRIVFDAGEVAGRTQRGREQGEEQAGAHAGFQHAAPAEAQPHRGPPESRDECFRCEVSILGGTLEGGVFFWRDGGFERRTDFLPAGPEIVLAGAAEAVLRQLRGAEADEAQQSAPARPASARGPTAQAPSKGGLPRCCRVPGRASPGQGCDHRQDGSCCRARPEPPVQLPAAACRRRHRPHRMRTYPQRLTARGRSSPTTRCCRTA